VLAARLGRVGVQPAVAAGCARIGRPCIRASQRCSDRCKGRHGAKTCHGHGAGTCKRGQNACTAPNPDALHCINNPTCSCFRRTAGTSFCADLGLANACAECARDADCVGLGGAACAPFGVGIFVGACEDGTICLPPCGAAAPPQAAGAGPRSGAALLRLPGRAG
jgi:hypothetical protein